MVLVAAGQPLVPTQTGSPALRLCVDLLVMGVGIAAGARVAVRLDGMAALAVAMAVAAVLGLACLCLAPWSGPRCRK